MPTQNAPARSDPVAEVLLRATSEESAGLERWTASLAATFGLPGVLVERIDLCLVEAMSNVIAYAYPRGAVGTMRISFWREPGELVLRVDDDGEAFDPTTYEMSPLPASLESAALGGRGIRLLRHYADELRYQRDGATNRLTLVFRSRGSEWRNGHAPSGRSGEAEHRPGSTRAASALGVGEMPPPFAHDKRGPG